MSLETTETILKQELQLHLQLARKQQLIGKRGKTSYAYWLGYESAVLDLMAICRIKEGE